MFITSDDMDSENENLKNRIIILLKEHPEGLTIKELSEFTKMHRQTVTKYIFELKGAGIVYRRPLGSATLHYLTSQMKHIINVSKRTNARSASSNFETSKHKMNEMRSVSSNKMNVLRSRTSKSKHT